MRMLVIIMLALMAIALLVMLFVAGAFVIAWLSRKIGGPYEFDQNKE